MLPLSRPPTRWLRLFRPGTLDLILTKMMRGDDPQDMADIRFLMDYDRINSSELEQAFADAVIPDPAGITRCLRTRQAPRSRPCATTHNPTGMRVSFWRTAAYPISIAALLSPNDSTGMPIFSSIET